MTGDTPPLVPAQIGCREYEQSEDVKPNCLSTYKTRGHYSNGHYQYSMGNIKLQEAPVNECTEKTIHVFDTRFASPGRSLDLADYIRYGKISPLKILHQSRSVASTVSFRAE